MIEGVVTAEDLAKRVAAMSPKAIEEQEYRRGYCDGFRMALDAMIDAGCRAYMAYDACVDFAETDLRQWQERAPDDGATRVEEWPPRYRNE